MKKNLPVGLYEQLLDDELQQLIISHPELRAVLRQIDDESAPHAYTQFVSMLLEQALRIVQKEERVPLLNRLIDLLAAKDGLEYLQRRRLFSSDKPLLIEVTNQKSTQLRPVTPLNSSALLTG
ncbi:NgoFVII family restriction endonuclease, partial [Myxococcota bacterium]|nr:NgoFVII family restriction endonuclease [Myxococcota bacterium]